MTAAVSSALRLAGVSAVSDTGPVRSRNEDGYLVDEALGLAAVADGMGGHAGGAQASAAALAVLREELRGSRAGGLAEGSDPDATAVDLRWRHTTDLLRAIGRANAALYRENRARGHHDGQGMGTTLTGWQWLPELGAIVQFHVGDSRLYRLRDGVLAQLTRDQTAYQLALEAGGAGELPPQNLLLQAIGPALAVEPDIVLHDVRAGDLLLLCSDGLHGWVPHADLELALHRAASLDGFCAGAVELAKLHGSRDNITAVVARFEANRNF